MMSQEITEGMFNPSFTYDNCQEEEYKHNLQLQEKNENNNVKVISDNDQVLIEDCALPCVKLRWLNMFRSPRWFLVFLCMAATIQGLCINGLVNVVITSIERRFGLQSTQSGIIASSYDIGSLVIMVPVSYFGGRVGASKPRWISLGLMCMGLGSLVWTIPHFATPVYNKHVETGDETGTSNLCSDHSGVNKDLECGDEDESTGSLSTYRYLFILGQFLHGIGAAPLVTLGTTFLDESVSVKSSPLYIGIFQTWFLIGPAIGFILGGQLLSFHTDFLLDSGLTSSSSLWVGAWWPGFLLTFVWAIICGFCLLCYPRSINRKRNTCQVSPDKKKENQNFGESFFHEFLSLIKNPTYMLLSVAVALDAIIVSGMASFMPKYMEHQYGMTNGNAAQIVGLLIVPAGGSATFLAGLFLKRFIKSRNQAITLCIIAHSITLPLWFIFMLSCPSLSYVGVNHVSNQSSSSLLSSPSSPYSPCNAACSCSTSSLDPVCGSDGLMYMSPCLAGCSANVGLNNFTQCSCVMEESASAVRKLCESDCGYLIPFVIVTFILIFLTFWISMPSTMATLRCVREHERSFALGLQTIIIRLLGSIPGPVLFGFFIDRTCLLWDNSSCGMFINRNNILQPENYIYLISRQV